MTLVVQVILPGVVTSQVSYSFEHITLLGPIVFCMMGIAVVCISWIGLWKVQIIHIKCLT